MTGKATPPHWKRRERGMMEQETEREEQKDKWGGRERRKEQTNNSSADTEQTKAWKWKRAHASSCQLKLRHPFPRLDPFRNYRHPRLLLPLPLYLLLLQTSGLVSRCLAQNKCSSPAVSNLCATNKSCSLVWLDKWHYQQTRISTDVSVT